MNLKYYLRGLGIGIIVTALLMGMATRDSVQMTDEEIKERAAMLGMVEPKVLADVSNAGTSGVDENEPEDAVEDTKQPIITQEPASTQEPEERQDTEVTPSPQEPIETQEPVSTQEPAETEEPGKPEMTEDPEKGELPETTEEPVATEAPVTDTSVTLVIVSGESSYSISKALVELGAITDATEFDTYLCTNRYDKSICTGTFEIPAGATYEEIAKIITKSN